jgi:hypothetical protein
MTFNVKMAKERKNVERPPYRIVQQESTESGSIEVWQLPQSQYAIQYLANEKGDNRWRVQEVYVNKEGQIRTRGDLPYKDYDSYIKALDHIQKNYEVEKQWHTQ